MPRHALTLRAVLIAVALLALSSAGEVGAQTRRALLVGINGYDRVARPGARPGDTAAVADSVRALVTGLNGALNDVEAVRDLLRARFGFDSARIRVLEDAAATHDSIISAIQHLTDEAQPGDVVVFYYAGHGSQRVNSKAKPRPLDQTIVPYDANRGVYDIRNKELARLFGALVNKRVVLTLIFDSCHSGAIARDAVAVKYTERWAGIDPRDAADPSTPPAPEDHGALVLSAAQDNQSASEMRDDADLPHGVFTNALLSVLRSVPPDEPVNRIMERVKAIMQSTGRLQEPVVAGKTRLAQPIFGGGPGAGAGLTTVAVLRMAGPEEVELQGGPAIGLRENAELVPFPSRPAGATVRLRVTQVLSLSRSTAHVIEGSRDSVHIGNLFAIDKWAPPPAAGLRVWVPPAGLDPTTLSQLTEELAVLRQADKLEWVDDPTGVPGDSTPLAVVQWRDGGWALDVAGRAVAQLSPPLTARAVQAALAPVKGRVHVSVLLPPTPELAAQLKLGRGTPNDLVAVTADRGNANYLLVGRLQDRHVEYAWVRPNASRAMARTSTLPIRTEWVEAGAGAEAGRDSTAAKLVDYALRLAKIQSWLVMEGPPDRGRFPYHLALSRPGPRVLLTKGPVYDGEYFGVMLRADSAQLKPWLEPRRVYVFIINSEGNSVLLFPPNGNVHNLVPYEQNRAGKWPAAFALGDDSLFYIRRPFGMDTYVLLTSDEVVPTDALEWEGVRTERTREAGASPLVSLLFGNSAAARDAGRPPVPLNWSIERLSILSDSAPPKHGN